MRENKSRTNTRCCQHLGSFSLPRRHGVGSAELVHLTICRKTSHPTTVPKVRPQHIKDFAKLQVSEHENNQLIHSHRSTGVNPLQVFPMKLSTAATALLLAVSANAQCETAPPFFNETSKPFSLVLTSENSTINGSTLSACHTGAALESLCLSRGGGVSNPTAIPASAFNFNTSFDPFTPNATLGTPGILTWTLQTATIDVPSSAFFNYDPTTNIAIPILRPGSDNPQLFAFDDQDRLNVQGSVDWSANPPNSTGSTQAYYRWYACQTYFSGYSYLNLAWGLGPEKPQNPTCVSVGVKRVFL